MSSSHPANHTNSNIRANTVSVVPINKSGKLAEPPADWSRVMASAVGLGLNYLLPNDNINGFVASSLIAVNELGWKLGFLTAIVTAPISTNANGSLVAGSLAAYAGVDIVNKVREYWSSTKYRILLDPRISGNKLVINGVSVDSMIIDQDNNVLADYKSRPLINLQIMEDGTLLFNGRPIVLLADKKYQNFAGTSLTRTPGGNFRDSWGSSYRTSTPTS